jgi:hypothetical protein
MTRREDEGWRRHVVEQMLPRLDANAGPAATGLTPGPITEAAAPTPLAGAFHTQPSFDPIELLPPAAADKLRMLRDRCSEKRAAMIPHSELQEAITKRTLAEQNLRRLQAHSQDHGFGLPPTDARVVAAEQQVARTSDNARRVQERSEKLAAAWRAASAPVAAVDDFLRFGVPGGTELQDHETEVPLAKGEASLLDQIEARRRRVRELKSDLHRVASAPFPSAHARAKIRQEVEALAQIGAPVVSYVIEHDAATSTIWPMRRMQSEVIAAERALAFAEVPDTLALFAWLHKEALIAALDREISTESDDAASLSHEDRAVRIAEIQGDVDAVEYAESALVFKAWTEGLACEHRADCSPCAILGIELRTVPRGETPATSPGYSWPMRR